jgi:hypothetical protein
VRRRLARDNEHHAGRDGQQPTAAAFFVAMALSTMRAASVGVICESQSAEISQLF